MMANTFIGGRRGEFVYNVAVTRPGSSGLEDGSLTSLRGALYIYALSSCPSQLVLVSGIDEPRILLYFANAMLSYVLSTI
jgi:hypothetical protein